MNSLMFFNSVSISAIAVGMIAVIISSRLLQSRDRRLQRDRELDRLRNE